MIILKYVKKDNKNFNYDTCVNPNLLNGYIHLYWTRPLTFALNGKYMGRCSIEFEKQWREYHLKFAYCLDDIRFKPLHVLCPQLVGAYISKEVTDLRKYISYLIWQ